MLYILRKNLNRHISLAEIYTHTIYYIVETITALRPSRQEQHVHMICEENTTAVLTFNMVQSYIFYAPQNIY